MTRLRILFSLLLFVAAGCASFSRDPTENYSTYQLRQMGERLLGARDLGQALKFLSLAEKRRPDDPVIQYDLGLAYYERGLKYDAFTHLKKALALKPGYPEAENALGRYYAEQGQLDQAQQCFERAVANPFYATPELALYNLGMIYEKKGDPEAALKQYQEAVRLQHNYGLAYYRMGLMLEQLRRADEAREAYGRATELSPDLIEAHYRYGVMSYTAGELENAFYSLDRVVKLAAYSTMAEDAKRILGRAQTIIPPGPRSRSSKIQPPDRPIEMDIVTHRDLVNEQKLGGVPSEQPNPAPLGEISQDEKGVDAGKAVLETDGRDLQDPLIGPKSRHYIVQVGSFLHKRNAELLQERLALKGYGAVVKPFSHNVLGQIYVVQLKPMDEADKARQSLMEVEREAHVKAIMFEVPVQ
jgi:type IV pilus assembly protein PilF